MQSLIALDQKIFLFFNQFNHQLLDAPMVFISGRIVWIPVVAFMLYTLYKTLPRKQFYIAIFFMGMAFIASDATSSSILKNLTQRLRPCKDELIRPLIHWFDQRCGGRFGFVSSHAANSFVLISFWWNALPERKPNYRWLWLFPALVAYSRLYLGVHYTGDLICGTIVGLCWGYLFSALFKKNTLGR